jgi:mRNA interferase RelE/StbE
MERYRLRFKRPVAKDLRSIPKKDVQRILEKIQALADDPRPPGCQKLTSRECYRLRQGPYRVLYEISDATNVVTIVKIAHRSAAYS